MYKEVALESITDLGTTLFGLMNADGNIDELGIVGTADTVGTGEAWLAGLDEISFYKDALPVAAIQSQYAAMNAVPEPSSLALLLSAFGIGLVGFDRFSLCRKR